jgi:hypothetical protein
MEIVERLRGELSGLLDAIHCAGGGIVFEEFPGVLGEDAGANALDGDTSKACRALIREVNELAEVLGFTPGFYEGRADRLQPIRGTVRDARAW